MKYEFNKDIRKFFDQYWGKMHTSFLPREKEWYFVVDADVVRAEDISVSMAQWDSEREVWYNDEHNPLTYYDFRDFNNNCSYGDKVTHYIDDSGMALFLFHMIQKELGKV